MFGNLHHSWCSGFFLTGQFADLYVGPSALGLVVCVNPGLRPGLIWDGPLALRLLDEEGVGFWPRGDTDVMGGMVFHEG